MKEDKFTIEILEELAKICKGKDIKPIQPLILLSEAEIKANWKHGILPDTLIPKRLKKSPEVMIQAIKDNKFKYGIYLVILDEPIRIETQKPQKDFFKY